MTGTPSPLPSETHGRGEGDDLLPYWRRNLGALPDPAGRLVGPWVPKLAAAMGHVHQPQRPRGGDIDGYGDLSRSGSYERLLDSEWALLKLSPLEFLRRAVMKEHLFLEHQRQRRQSGQHHLVLLDAGPELIGAPRLVQLAALVVFERRARACGAMFSWAVIQDETRSLHGAVEKDAVESWFRVASFEQPSTHVIDWLGLLGPLRGCELWLVTAPSAAASAAELLPAHGKLLIRELSLWSDSARSYRHSILHRGHSLDRLLEAEVHSPEDRASSFRQRVLLPMPSESAALGVLRQPFREERERSTLSITSAGVRILPGGNHILVYDQDRRLGVLPLQQARGAFAGRFRYFSGGRDTLLVAAGFSSRRQTRVAVHWDSEHELLEVVLVFGRNSAEQVHRVELGDAAEFVAAAATCPKQETALPAPLFVLGSVADLWMLLGNGLVRVVGERASLVQSSVDLAYWARGNGIVSISRAAKGERSVVFHSGRGPGRTLFRIPAGAEGQVFAGFPDQSGYPAGAIAVRCGEGWSLHLGPSARKIIKTDPGESAVGICGLPSAGVCLLSLDKDRHQLLFRGQRRVGTLLRARDPILEVATSVQTSRIVARTEKELLGVTPKHPGGVATLVPGRQSVGA